MEESQPIGGALAFALIAFGLILDLIQIVLAILLIGEIIDPLIDIIAMLGFGIMLYSHGGGIFSRRTPSFVMTGIAEFIPVVDVLPMWTIFAIYTVVMDRVRNAAPLPPPSRSRNRSWRL